MNPATLRLGGRDLALDLSAAAAAALAAREAPLVVEMELYFSCLIRKRLRFPPVPHVDALCVPAAGRLTVCFRPVMTRACAMRDGADQPELEAFPIARPQAFLPRWLKLDYRDGQWSGEFGY